MNPLIKICGITRLADAEMVSSYFPDFLGFIFHAPSPRNISFADAQDISDCIRVSFGEASPLFIGVFVNPKMEDLVTMAPFLDGFQLHGEESPEFCEEVQKSFPSHQVWKAFRVSQESSLEDMRLYPMADVLLVDAFCESAHGGTGKTIDTNLLPLLREYVLEDQKLFLAGGISSHNKDEVMALSCADGIDISSSVEKTPGNKSEKKIEQLFCE